MKRLKKFFVILYAAIITSIILFSCSLPGVSLNKKESEKHINGNIIQKKTGGGYLSGQPYFSQEALKYGNSSTFIEYFQSWTSAFCTNGGCPSNSMRVQRDIANKYDTVSEGIGYGMLLAVYFNNQTLFDNLYNYCKSHFIIDEKTGSIVPLMHWKVDSKGNNVSGFADYVADTSTVFTVSVNGKNVQVKGTNPIVPHDVVYGSLKTGKIIVVPWKKDYSEALKNLLNNDSNYYQMSLNPDYYSTATDADEDIAAALCFASKSFINSSSYYAKEATSMINAMQQFDFSSDGFIKNGNRWGGQDGWNPSYVTPAYYKFLFAKFGDSTFWNKVYDRMYKEMNFVKSSILEINGNNTSSVFYPDWCSTKPTGKMKSAFGSAKNISDRMFYNNGQPTDKKPSNPLPSGYDLDARWTDGTTKEQYNAHLLSFNSFYDAIRVPWRISVDYAWGGSSASSVYSVINASFKNYDAFVARKDGCSVTGGQWNWNDRDGSNRNEGGKDKVNAIFRNMAVCSQLTTDADPRYGQNNLFGNTTNVSFSAYTYYSYTLTFLSLLFVTGKFQNLCDDKFSYPTNAVYLLRYYNPTTGDHFYTIDQNEIGGGGSYGYNPEGYECRVYKTSIINGRTVPLYRAYKSATGDHFYTTSWDEMVSACTYYGYNYEGMSCNVYPSNDNGTIPVYRYYNGRDHFYTISSTTPSGYNQEGIAFYAFKSF